MKDLLKYLMIGIAINPGWAFASTFVGNGGGAGDIELMTTKQQIEDSFRVITRRSQDGGLALCRCNRLFEGRSVCDPLRPLNNDQRKFCAQTLMKQAEAVLALVSNPDALSIRWTDDEIRVADRGQTRAVDAVTNRDKRELTINLKRFLQMKQFERVFLITHELMHLTDFDGKPLVDEGPIGPFVGDQGGRQMLNTLGSSVAVMQGEFPHEIGRYRGRLNRSQAWKPWWFDLNVGQANPAGHDGTFSAQHFNRTQMTVRYGLGDWVLAASYRTEFHSQKVLGSIDVNERKYIYSLGAGYRLYPFGDPLTYFGQSHFLLQGLVDYMKADLKLTDGIQFKESVDKFGFNLSLNYYLPFFWGFWWTVGIAYEIHPYEYKNVNLAYKNVFSHYLGVAYAF